MTAFTMPDLIVIVVLCAFFVRGLLRGALREVFSLAALGAGLWASVNLAGRAAALLAGWAGDAAWIGRIAPAAAFLAVWFAVALVGWVVASLAQAVVSGGWSRLVGALLGAAKGALIVAAVVAALDVQAAALLPPRNQQAYVFPYIRRLSGFLRSQADRLPSPAAPQSPAPPVQGPPAR